MPRHRSINAPDRPRRRIQPDASSICDPFTTEGARDYVSLLGSIARACRGACLSGEPRAFSRGSGIARPSGLRRRGNLASPRTFSRCARAAIRLIAATNQQPSAPNRERASVAVGNQIGAPAPRAIPPRAQAALGRQPEGRFPRQSDPQPPPCLLASGGSDRRLSRSNALASGEFPMKMPVSCLDCAVGSESFAHHGRGAGHRTGGRRIVRSSTAGNRGRRWSPNAGAIRPAVEPRAQGRPDLSGAEPAHSRVAGHSEGSSKLRGGAHG
jgi:hypothetical protein